jgi:XTP/dITP diphosphohydrolase
MTTKLLVATRNPGKLRELRELFAHLEITLVSPDDVPRAPADVVEEGATFEANARKKAWEYARATGMLSLADDSGLAVDALGGEPGVRSARWAGPHATDGENNRLLLDRLADVDADDRTARFHCVLALADPDGPLGLDVHCEDGLLDGLIVNGARGRAGFGYDPLFVPAGRDRTLAELGPAEKNAISHRRAAAEKMGRFLAGYLKKREAE